MVAVRQYHLVWAGGPFPPVYRLAVLSALAADPTCTVRVHVLDTVSRDGPLAALGDLPRTTLEHVDPATVFGELPEHLGGCRAVYDALPPGSAAARSNLLRYALLYVHGGVYIDFDVIVLRPLHDISGASAFVGAERVWVGDQPRVAGRRRALLHPRHAVWAISWAARRLDAKWFGGRLRASNRLERIDRCWSALQANNAIIGAEASSSFVDVLLRRAIHASPVVRYALGPTLVHEAALAAPDLVEVLAPAVLYQVPPGESFRFFEDRTLHLSPDAAAVHYVGSNHDDLLRTLRLDDPRFGDRDELFWRLGRAVTAPSEVVV